MVATIAVQVLSSPVAGRNVKNNGRLPPPTGLECGRLDGTFFIAWQMIKATKNLH